MRPANSGAQLGPDQSADADGDRQRDQRTAPSVVGDLAERIAARWAPRLTASLPKLAA